MISIFTPSHKTKNLKQAYESLTKQTLKEFEWVILINGEEGDSYGAAEGVVTIGDTQKILGIYDGRVKVFIAPKNSHGNIGWLKKKCCELATGDIYFELDHDDFLEPTALEKCQEAFNDQTVDFVYSDCYERKADGTTFMPYGAYWGWKYHTEPDGKIVTLSHDVCPASMSWIFFAPNHYRSFRASFYHRIGGYDETLDCCDDFDIVCRTYIHGKMHHIKEPLYNYIHTGENTSGTTDKNNKNAKIQQETARLHDLYIEQICLKYCQINNLPALDLGGRFNSPTGFTTVDLRDAEIIADLTGPWPFPDNSIGLIRAHHILEHLPDTIHFFNEAFRVMQPGAFLLIEVPSTSGAGAFSDPTHIKFFNQRSFQYYTNQQISQYIQPQYHGKFQLNRINEYFWHNSDVSVIQAHLIALKGDYEQNWIGEKLM